jgi:hypothetical protein
MDDKEFKGRYMYGRQDRINGITGEMDFQLQSFFLSSSVCTNPIIDPTKH